MGDCFGKTKVSRIRYVREHLIDVNEAYVFLNLNKTCRRVLCVNSVASTSFVPCSQDLPFDNPDCHFVANLHRNLDPIATQSACPYLSVPDYHARRARAAPC